jgi:hypothetical protein
MEGSPQQGTGKHRRRDDLTGPQTRTERGRLTHVSNSTARRTGSVALVLGLLLAAPAAAAPNLCAAPPGTGAVDQYCESTPGATTSTPPGGRHGGSGNGANSGSGPAVPPGTASRLREQHGGGAVLDGLPAQPAKPHGDRSRSPGRTAAADGSPRGARDHPESSPSSAVAGLSASIRSLASGQMGGTFLILAAAMVAALAYVAGRRLRTGA